MSESNVVEASDQAAEDEKQEQSKPVSNAIVAEVDDCREGVSTTVVSDEDMTEDSNSILAIATKKASEDPNFAVICSFFQIFGDFIGLPKFSIDDLEVALTSTNELATNKLQEGLLEVLYVKLMRKLAKSCKTQYSSLARVSLETLPKFLSKVCNLLDLSFAWDLTTFGYHVLSIANKLLLLKSLCDLQFDENPKLHSFINDQYVKLDNTKTLRLKPIGSDIDGRLAWFQEDFQHDSLRLYMVEDDDDDGTSWKLVASNPEELETVIGKLKAKSECNPKDKALQQRKERKDKAKKIEVEEVSSPAKAKKAKKKTKKTTAEPSDDEDDNPCARCFSNRNPEEVLLCDGCDAAYHTLCLRPPLLTIPETDWYCPYCQQVALCDRLVTKLGTIVTRIKAKQRASKRMDFYGIKLSNIVDDSAADGLDDAGGFRRSGRSRKQIDYNFSDFDRIINEATGSKRDSPLLEDDSTRRRSHRRLNDLDATGEFSSGNEYQYDDEDDTRRSLRSRHSVGQRSSSRQRLSRRRLRSCVDSDDNDSSPTLRRTKRKCLLRNSLLMDALAKDDDGKNNQSDADDDYDEMPVSTQDESEADSVSASEGSIEQDLSIATDTLGQRRRKKSRVMSDSESDIASNKEEDCDEASSDDEREAPDTDDLCQSDDDEVNGKPTEDEDEEEDSLAECTDADVKSKPPPLISVSSGTSTSTSQTASLAATTKTEPDISDPPRQSNDKAFDHINSELDHKKPHKTENPTAITASSTPKSLESPMTPTGLFQPYQMQPIARSNPMPTPSLQRKDNISPSWQDLSHNRHEIPPARKKPTLSFGVDQLTSPSNLNPRSPPFNPSSQFPIPPYNYQLSPEYMRQKDFPSPPPARNYGYGGHALPMYPSQLPAQHYPRFVASHIPKQHPLMNPGDFSPHVGTYPSHLQGASPDDHLLRTNEFQGWNPMSHFGQPQQQQQSSNTYQVPDPLRNFPYHPSGHK